MRTYPTPPITNKLAVLSYTAAFLMLLALGTSFFAGLHNDSHAVQTDNYCAECLVVDDFDNAISFPNLLPLALSLTGDAIEIIAIRYLPLFTRTTGNRDPPLIA